MEAIILAGGLGTRLRSVIGEALPKCMAPVAGVPFLQHLLRYLEEQGATRVILSLGHGHRHILDWLDAERRTRLEVLWVIEEEPLGTGGGIRLALEAAREEVVFILNGDTFFDVPLASLGALLRENSTAETALALKPMRDYDRYGTVVLEETTRVVNRFEEKAPRAEGLINGGAYAVRRETFLAHPFPQKFSFEKEYLEAVVETGVLRGLPCGGYFIDIGIPGDYERAQTELGEMREARSKNAEKAERNNNHERS